VRADCSPESANGYDGILDMRFVHGVMDGGQGYPLSHKKSNSSSVCDHRTRLGLRAVFMAVEVGSLSFARAVS